MSEYPPRLAVEARRLAGVFHVVYLFVFACLARLPDQWRDLDRARRGG